MHNFPPWLLLVLSEAFLWSVVGLLSLLLVVIVIYGYTVFMSSNSDNVRFETPAVVSKP